MLDSFERHCVLLQRRMIAEYETKVRQYARMSANEPNARKAAHWLAQSQAAQRMLNTLILARDHGNVDYHVASEMTRRYGWQGKPNATVNAQAPAAAQLSLF